MPGNFTAHDGQDQYTLNQRFRPHTRTYTIRGSDGVVWGLHKHRYDQSGGKQVRWRGPNGERKLGTKVARMPLYLAEKSRGWPGGWPVVVAEGEPAADALSAVGIPAVGTTTGAASCPGPESLEVLRGRTVILWADQDQAGVEHMRRVARSLREIASSIRWFEWPDAPEGGDAADHPALTKPYKELARRELEALLTGLREAPEAVVQEPERETGRARNPGRVSSRLPDGAPIPEGSRHTAMISIAGGLHDGSRDRDQLAADLMAENEARCSPALPEAEVLGITAWVHEQTPCSRGRPPELLAAIATLGADWYAAQRPGVGGKSEASVMRFLITTASRVGTLRGELVRVELSYRQLAEAVGSSRSTVQRAVGRLVEQGALRTDPARDREDRAGAFLLIPMGTATNWVHPPTSTHNTSSVTSLGGVPTSSRRAPVEELETLYFRWRGLVGKSREEILCCYEAGGALTDEELAERLGWSRPRDLRQRHLEPLVRLGLLEARDDGTRAVPHGYVREQEGVKSLKYSVCRRREFWEYDPVAGDWIYHPDKFGFPASERQREAWDAGRHDKEREAFRAWMAAKAERARQTAEAEAVNFEDLPPVVALPRPGGGTRYVDPKTGEIRAERDQAKPDHGVVREESVL